MEEGARNVNGYLMQKNGGPAGSEGYWKVNQHGVKGWNGFNQAGQPITPFQVRPGNLPM